MTRAQKEAIKSASSISLPPAILQIGWGGKRRGGTGGRVRGRWWWIRTRRRRRRWATRWLTRRRRRNARRGRRRRRQGEHLLERTDHLRTRAERQRLSFGVVNRRERVQRGRNGCFELVGHVVHRLGRDGDQRHLRVEPTRALIHLQHLRQSTLRKPPTRYGNEMILHSQHRHCKARLPAHACQQTRSRRVVEGCARPRAVHHLCDCCKGPRFFSWADWRHWRSRWRRWWRRWARR